MQDAGAGPKAKASGVITFMEVVRDILGPERLASMLARLEPDTRELWDKPPLPTSWIDDVHVGRILRALAPDMSDAEFVELGREQMERDMKTTYKVLVKLATPVSLAKRAPTIWSTYTQNGRMRAELVGDRQLDVWLEDVVDRDENFWTYQRGTITRVFEFTRAKDIQCELVEGGGTSGRARYRLTWR